MQFYNYSTILYTNFSRGGPPGRPLTGEGRRGRAKEGREKGEGRKGHEGLDPPPRENPVYAPAGLRS